VFLSCCGFEFVVFRCFSVWLFGIGMVFDCRSSILVWFWLLSPGWVLCGVEAGRVWFGGVLWELWFLAGWIVALFCWRSGYGAFVIFRRLVGMENVVMVSDLVVGCGCVNSWILGGVGLLCCGGELVIGGGFPRLYVEFG